MISDRYLCKLRVRISWRKVDSVALVMAVRSRLIKAVFFFKDESRVLLTANTSSRDEGRSKYARVSQVEEWQAEQSSGIRRR